MNNMSPVVRALLTSAIFVACLLGFWYVKDVLIDHGTFHPNWMYVVILVVVSFLSELYFENKKQ